nr:hypothetical protein [Saprospiraceae bacterium]
MNLPTNTPRAIMPFSFNISFSKDEDIERIFVTRLGIFQYLFEQIVAEQPNSIPQHHLVIGERGMGKSTLLHRIAVELRKPEHSDAFLPLTFPEEQYNVDRLSKFWLNCLDALGDALDRREDKTGLDELDANINQWEKHGRNITAMEMYGHFEAWCKRFNQRVVLLVDNLNLIFGKISKEEQHQLRSILMQNGAPILVGASAHSIEEVVDYGAPFYDAFKVQTLKKLAFEEVLDTLKNLANITNNPSLVNKIYANRGRLRALYALTGGTPRTLTMLFPLIQNDFSINIQTDLEAMVDTATALYKSRFEELSEQMQVIVDAIALHWDPVHLEALREITHYENSTLSPQIKRLYDTGWLNRLDAYKAKGSAYEISERFFNIWYLMRRSSRRKKRELVCLTRFLNMLYAEELPQMARKMLKGSMEHSDHAALHLAMADAVKSPKLAKQLRDRGYEFLMDRAVEDDGVLRDFEIPKEVIKARVYELAKEAQSAHEKKDFETELKLIRNISKLIDDDGSFMSLIGNLYISDEQFDIAEDILKATTEVFPKNADAWFALGSLYQDYLCSNELAESAYLKALEIEPKHAKIWNNIGSLKIEQGLFGESEKAYQKAIEYDTGIAEPWINLGKLYFYDLDELEKAENSYLKAIEINANYAESWEGLGILYRYGFKKYEKAEKAFLNAIEIDSKLEYIWDTLGNLYQDNLKNYEQAEIAYKKEFENYPKNTWPIHNLIFLYRDKTNRMPEAKTLFEKLKPEDGCPDTYYLHAALFAYYDKNLGIASEALKKALE